MTKDKKLQRARAREKREHSMQALRSAGLEALEMLRDMPSLQMESLDMDKAILAAPDYNYFEKMMLYHINRAAREALQLYSNLEGWRALDLDDVRKMSANLRDNVQHVSDADEQPSCSCVGSVSAAPGRDQGRVQLVLAGVTTGSSSSNSDGHSKTGSLQDAGAESSLLQGRATSASARGGATSSSGFSPALTALQGIPVPRQEIIPFDWDVLSLDDLTGTVWGDPNSLVLQEALYSNMRYDEIEKACAVKRG